MDHTDVDEPQTRSARCPHCDNENVASGKGHGTNRVRLHHKSSQFTADELRASNLCSDARLCVALIGTVIAALALTAPPALGACDTDVIKLVASDGEILITESGQMYHVLPGDDFYSAIWLPTGEIIICDDDVVWFEGESRAIYAIINKDENSEHVSAFKGRYYPEPPTVGTHEQGLVHGF